MADLFTLYFMSAIGSGGNNGGLNLSTTEPRWQKAQLLATN
jgi:hypothetical protein